MICGIDLGSRSVKIALMGDGKELEFQSYDTIGFYRKYGRREGDQLVIDFSALGYSRIENLISTGYGRNAIKIKGGQDIPEIKAHVLGASYQSALSDFTLLDLGGQDSKVALVRGGKLVDFQTNDKCAASSGRYLENMAQVLGIDLEELSKHYESPLELDSTCAIFGESELIGKILEGHSIDNLAAAVNQTIVKRVKPMLRNLESPQLVFVGGVAKNGAIVKILERDLGLQVLVPKYPQYNGAIGCCVYGMNNVKAK